ncbi:hypothetical protein [Saccharopolyspora spinosa]|uniref:hypothetical protein n=1 Tax=Saccharopolyspora spinosa TaxID=60894 RepID=UPI00117AD058|nr:hypothetical protein [Saccharopolyspora spinosa]
MYHLPDVPRHCPAIHPNRSTNNLEEEETLPGVDIPPGYWAAFGYHNHVLPARPRYREDGKLTALCGVLTLPSEAPKKDNRPACSWCSEEVQTGQIRIVPKPDAG